MSADISDAVGYFGSPGFGNRVVKTHATGHLHDANDPSEDNQLARKAYVDKIAFPREIKLIKGAVDLNDYTETGVYHQALNRDVEAGTNYPGKLAGLLEVFNPEASMIYQRYTEYGTANNVWTRGLYSNKWSSWVKASQNGHKHTSGDITDTTNDAGSSEFGGKVLVPREKDGKIFYYSNPTEYREIARKGYVDSVGNTKADKNHKHTMADISDLPAIGFTEGTIAKYASNGTLIVQDNASRNTATSRGYVDSRIQVVSSLPSSPESDVLYVITE